MPTLDYPRADGHTPGDGSHDMKQPPLQDERIGLWTAGVEFAVVVGVLTAGGYWLDDYKNTLPLWTLVGLAVGFAAALYRLIRQVKPKPRETPDKEKNETTK